MDRKPPETADDSLLMLACPYEKAILRRTCACRHAERRKVRSRSTIQCRFEEGHGDCVSALSHARKTANFTFRAARAPSALPRAQAIKLQCGGLIGLQNALDKVVQNHRVDDIYALIQRALRRYGSFQGFPEQEIVRGIASYES